MSDAENFKHWYKERCGHGLAVNIAMKAVIELEKEIAELREALLRKSSHATNLEHEISQLCTEKAELIHALLELSEWKPFESYENALYEAKELLAKHK